MLPKPPNGATSAIGCTPLEHEGSTLTVLKRQQSAVMQPPFGGSKMRRERSFSAGATFHLPKATPPRRSAGNHARTRKSSGPLNLPFEHPIFGVKGNLTVAGAKNRPACVTLVGKECPSLWRNAARAF